MYVYKTKSKHFPNKKSISLKTSEFKELDFF